MYSVYAGSETVGFLVSFLKKVVTLGLSKDDFGHWWVVFRTRSAFYVAQFGGNLSSSSSRSSKSGLDGHIVMKRCSTLSQCHKFGEDFTPRMTPNPHIFHSSNYSGKGPRTIYMREVFEWLRTYDSDYGVFTHNCQDFVRDAYKQFWEAFDFCWIWGGIHATRLESFYSETRCNWFIRFCWTRTTICYDPLFWFGQLFLACRATLNRKCADCRLGHLRCRNPSSQLNWNVRWRIYRKHIRPLPHAFLPHAESGLASLLLSSDAILMRLQNNGITKEVGRSMKALFESFGMETATHTKQNRKAGWDRAEIHLRGLGIHFSCLQLLRLYGQIEGLAYHWYHASLDGTAVKSKSQIQPCVWGTESDLPNYEAEGIPRAVCSEQKPKTPGEDKWHLQICIQPGFFLCCFSHECIRGAHVIIANRTKDKAVRLAEQIPNSSVISLEDLRSGKIEAGVLANGTSLGMEPNVDSSPVPKETLQNFELVFDAVYTPKETKLLREAAEMGCRTASGVGMFIGQAKRQFELFTGKKAPSEAVQNLIQWCSV